MPPRTKPPGERQAELLDAAQELFVDKGIHATTIEEITNRAGVSKGSFYQHYKSKDDIVVALGVRFGRRVATELADAAAAEIDWGEKLDLPMRAMGLSRATPDGAAPLRTFPSLVPVFALDRIYTRGFRCTSAFVPRGDTWARMSDHLPCVAELAME